MHVIDWYISSNNFFLKSLGIPRLAGTSIKILVNKKALTSLFKRSHLSIRDMSEPYLIGRKANR